MNANLIDLTKYISWFLRRYVWPHKTPTYKDAIMLIARRLDIVDMAMIYEALTGQQYGDQTNLYLESLTVHSNIYKFLRPRANILDSHMIPANAINDYEYLIMHAHVHKVTWLIKAIESNNLAPLQYAIRAGYDWAQYEEVRLFNSACDVDSVECVKILHQAGIKIGKCSYIRPRTAPLLREIGVKFGGDPYGALLCAVAGVELQYTSGYNLTDLCTIALESGKHLDWIHARLHIDEIAKVIVDNYHPRSLRWLIDHNASIELLDTSAFSKDDFTLLLPIMSLQMRANLLATSTTARHVYKMQQFDFCRETFRQKASSKIWKKVHRM